MFFGVGLRQNILSGGLRGGEKDVSCVTALYADIDIKGDAHAQKALLSSAHEAVGFLNNLKIKPSIIVNSGNGIHSYWLLDTPFIIKTQDDKNYIVSIFKSFGKYINVEGKKRGWKLDSVYDLARILRVSGTINHKLKNNVRCEVAQNNSQRYSLESFSQEDKPHTCEYIRENLNFYCGRNCPVKAPIVYGLPSLEKRFKELVYDKKINVEDVFFKRKYETVCVGKN